MTETAQMADMVLPATMFLEHDDVYQGGGHQYILLGPKLVEPPGECRSNHEVICGLASRLGAEHPGFAMTPRELIDWTLRHSGWGTLAELEAKRWIDCQPRFRDRALSRRLRLAGRQVPLQARLAERAVPQPLASPDRSRRMPKLPDHWDVIEEADAGASVPARDLAGARLPQLHLQRDADLARAGRPPDRHDPSRRCGRSRRSPTATRSCSATGAARCGLHAQLFDGVRRGVLIAEFDLAQRRLRGRPRHQHAHRRRRHRALWRRRVPRQQGVDPARVGRTMPSAM